MFRVFKSHSKIAIGRVMVMQDINFGTFIKSDIKSGIEMKVKKILVGIF